MTRVAEETVTETAVSVSVDVDLELHLECDWPMSRCEVEPDWVGVTECLHWEQHFCTEHYRTMRWQAEANLRVKVVRCPTCEVVPVITWRPL